jgi:hypothetical protein
MYVFKCFLDFTKEEKWLNEMARKGYELTSNSFGYNFKKITPEEASYRVDYRKFKSQKDFIDYCTLFEDSGWKHISGSKSSGNQYFKKISPNSDEDIFSDNLSKASRYKRASNIWLSSSITYSSLLFIFVMTGAVRLEAFINPKSLYYTPGLWDKSGVDFWKSFLFETPFALSRGFIWLIFPVCISFYLYFIYKSNHLYKESITQN